LIFLSISARVILNPLANVFQKQLINRGNPALLINFIIYAILSIAGILAAFNVPWSGLSSDFWKYSLIVGVLGAFANWFFIKSLDGGELSVVGPLNSFKAVIGILGGILFLGEIPNFFGLIGVILVSYGSYIVVSTPGKPFTWKTLKNDALLYRFGGMVLGAIEAVFLKKVIINSSPVIALIIYCWFGALFSFLLLLPNRTSHLTYIKVNDKGNIKLFMYAAISLVFVQLGTNYALEHIPVGYTLTLFQLQAIFSILFGYKIFREQKIAKKLLGSILMVFGATVIILKG
jgi:drug/metabolite transporter (DMT)-like permease